MFLRILRRRYLCLLSVPRARRKYRRLPTCSLRCSPQPRLCVPWRFFRASHCQRLASSASPTYVSLALYELEDSQNPFSVASAHTQTKSVTCALFEPPRSRFLPRNLRYSVNWPSSFGFLHSPLHPGDFCAFGPTCRCYESSSSWGVPFATKHLNRSLSTSN